MCGLVWGFAQCGLGSAKVLTNPKESERKLFKFDRGFSKHGHYTSSPIRWLLVSQGTAGDWECLKQHLQNHPNTQP